MQTLPFYLAEFNPFVVTIRYDDLDDEVSFPLLQDMFDKTQQVRAVIIDVLAKSIRP